MAAVLSDDFSKYLNNVNVELDNTLLERPRCTDLTEYYELLKCARWIEENVFLRVSLQFPDELLHHADLVSTKLQEHVKNTSIYVLADTSYSSCCVDEVAAEHVSSDAVIHFGPACLTPCNRLPVLYIFGKKPVNLARLTQEFLNGVPNTSIDAILVFDVAFSHISDELYGALREFYPNLRPSELVIPSNVPSDATAAATKSASSAENDFSISGRTMKLKEGLKIEDYALFYIGQEGPMLNTLMMTLNRCRVFSYDPHLEAVREESLAVNASLKRRYFAVEKARDARIVGILMGTLGVLGYLQVVQRLKDVAKAARKKTYTIVVGKLNPAKLANFPEIDIFVMVACPDNSVVNFKEFYQPVVTPFEFELACMLERKWTGEYVTDFRELMPGARHYVPLGEADDGREPMQTNVSLITGRLSALSTRATSDDADQTVATREDVLTVAEIHRQAGGEYLTNRSWQGLDGGPVATTAAVIRQGACGTAASYDHETQLANNKM